MLQIPDVPKICVEGSHISSVGIGVTSGVGTIVGTSVGGGVPTGVGIAVSIGVGALVESWHSKDKPYVPSRFDQPPTMTYSTSAIVCAALIVIRERRPLNVHELSSLTPINTVYSGSRKIHK